MPRRAPRPETVYRPPSLVPHYLLFRNAGTRVSTNNASFGAPPIAPHWAVNRIAKPHNSCTAAARRLYSGSISSHRQMSGFARKGGRSIEEFTHDDHAIDAQGHRRLAGRQYLALVRPDCRPVPPASARGEGYRRRRFGAGHQRPRSGVDRPADPRRDRRRRGRSEPPPAPCRTEGADAGTETEERPALHAGVAPPGPAERHSVAGAQPPGA